MKNISLFDKTQKRDLLLFSIIKKIISREGRKIDNNITFQIKKLLVL